MILSNFKTEGKTGSQPLYQAPDYMNEYAYYMCFKNEERVSLYAQIGQDDGELLNYDVLGDELLFSELDITFACKGYATSCWPIIQFAAEICELRSPYLYKELLDTLPKIIAKTGSTHYVKLAKYIIFQPGVFEKMLKSLPMRVIVEELKNDEPLIEDQGKLSKSIGLSTDNISRINRYKIHSSMTVLKQIAEIDNNYAEDVLDFIEIWKRIDKKFELGYGSRPEEYYVLDMLTAVLELLNWGYELKPLLNYVTKQSIVYKDLSFPKDITMTLRDYVSMGVDMNAPYDKYPQYLQKAHFIFARNYSVIDDAELAEDFEEATKKYLNLEIIEEEYSLVVPKAIGELVEEGNSLHHCITSYARKIIRGESIILFLRSSSKIDEPFVTVEVNKDNRITQIKGIYDQEVPLETRKIVEGLLKKVS